MIAVHAVAETPPLANPLWFQHNGATYQVGMNFNNNSNTLEYSILDASGTLVVLPDADLQGLAWAYDMAQSVYMQPDKLVELNTLHQSLQTVQRTHYTISALAKLQDKLVQAGVAATAAYFGDAPTAFKVLSDAAIGELTDAILNSPKIAAREWGRAMVDSGLDRLDKVIRFVENRDQPGVGESAAKALDVAEVQARYKDAVMVDTFLMPAAELTISLQRKGDFKSQVKDLADVLTGSVAGTAKGTEVVKALLAAREFSKALAESVPAFKDCMEQVQSRRTHWANSTAGDGETPPAGFVVASGLPSDILTQPAGQNITTDQARTLLPYADLALAVYGDDPLPDGWKEIALKGNLHTPKRDYISGFHAGVYQGPGGQVVIAYEGTKSIPDWFNNIKQITDLSGTPDQYKQALALARKIKTQYNAEDITLVGHSLGGGLAQYAGAMEGLETVTFNHAGLWFTTFLNVKLRGDAGRSPMTHIVSQSFIFKDQEFVKSKQDIVSRLGIHLGQIVRVPMKSADGKADISYRHNMQNLRDAIRAVADVPTLLAADQTIIAIVDSSGSMQKTDPADLRKAALLMMIDTLDDTTALGLVDFDHKARLLTAPVRLGSFNSSDRQRLKSLVGSIDSDGNTDIAAGLETAAGQVLSDGSQVTLVLLTDGKDPKWKGQPGDLPAGVSVHTIALSDKADQDSLAQLATATNGIAEIARNADDLKRIIGNLFGEAVNQEVLLVKTGAIEQGDDIVYEVYVDSGHSYLTFQADWSGSDVDLVLIDPTGRRYDTASAVTGGFGIEAANYDIIRVNDPPPGRWQAHLLGVQLPAGGEPYTFRVSSNDSAIKSRWKMNMPVPEVGTPMAIDLSSQGDVQWNEAHIEIWQPDGTRDEQTISIGGVASALGGDSGVNVLNFVPRQDGVYQVQITVQGQTPGGEKVQRSFDRTLRVAPPGKGQRYKRQLDPFIRRMPGMLQ